MSLKPIKVILLGDEKVGKSSLYDKFVNGKFPISYIPSKATQFKQNCINVNGESIHLKFFDTPGNEQRHKIYSSVYVDSNGIIVIFDLTKKETFENIFKKWIPNFFNFLKFTPAHNFPLIILGNYNDLANKRQLQKQEIEVRLKEVNNFTNYFFYQEISIKTDKIPNLIKKVLLFIISKPQSSPSDLQSKTEEKGLIPATTQILNENNEINILKEKIKVLELEKIESDKREKEEKDKIKSLNEKVQTLEQMKQIFTDKDKIDKEAREKLNERIKTLLEENKKLASEVSKKEDKRSGNKKERQMAEEREMLNERILVLEQQKLILAEDNKKKNEIEKMFKEEKEKMCSEINQLNEKIKKLEEEKINILGEKSRIEKEEKEKGNKEKIQLNEKIIKLKEEKNIILEENNKKEKEILEKMNKEKNKLNERIKKLEEEKKNVLDEFNKKENEEIEKRKKEEKQRLEKEEKEKKEIEEKNKKYINEKNKSR